MRYEEYDVSDIGRDASAKIMSENKCEMQEARLWSTFTKGTNTSSPSLSVYHAIKILL